MRRRPGGRPRGTWYASGERHGGAALTPSSTVDLVGLDLEAARLEARLGLRAVPLEEDLLGLARLLELAQGVVDHFLEAALALPDADGQRLGAQVLLEHHVLRLLRSQLGVAVEQCGLVVDVAHA